jgi:UDP-2-acetamido-3-amino-2,3-dideoxy-glucuronate N-acetyltransferase
MSSFVHPLAHVDADVQIGEGTKIWQFASVTRGTILGKNCSVSPFAMLDGSVYGDGVIISGGVMAGAGFKVGNNVFLGPNVVLANDLWPFASKEGYDDTALRGGEKFAVIIDDGAAIGAGAVLLPGVRIGKGSVVAAGAVVPHSIADGVVFNADGYVRLKINPEWQKYRMRWAP